MDGNKLCEANYRNGILDGKYIKWRKNMVVDYEEEYQNGKLIRNIND